MDTMQILIIFILFLAIITVIQQLKIMAVEERLKKIEFTLEKMSKSSRKCKCAIDRRLKKR